MKRIIVSKKTYRKMVKSVLDSVMDTLQYGLPPFSTYKERVEVNSNVDATILGSYERGIIECAGMTLGVFNARFRLEDFPEEIQDGIGIIDALELAGEFHSKIEQLFEECWKDKGVALNKKLKEKLKGKKSSWTKEEVFPFVIDTEKCAKQFVKSLKEEQ